MTINCKGKIIDLSSPIAMGILNVTPDSFYDGGKWNKEDDILRQAEKMLLDGATIIDIGGMSSRPGATIISAQEEIERVLPAIQTIQKNFPDAMLSIDTIHALVAEAAIQNGAAIINDISAGTFDEQMIALAAKYKVPFIIMHKKGMPADMQQNPEYENVVTEVFDFLQQQLHKCKSAGIADVIVDVGFGFGKTIEHNYSLLKNLKAFESLGCPMLLGISRKSMISKLLNIKTTEALNGTTALNMAGLMNGANMLRVHDVREAIEVITLYNKMSVA